MKRIINDRNQKEKRRILRKNQTIHEQKIWKLLKAKKSGLKWRRQISIGCYVADFYCREKRLVIEIDGSQHSENREYDKIREEYFLAVGVKTLRFWNNEIEQSIEGVYMRICNEVKSLESGENLNLI